MQHAAPLTPNLRQLSSGGIPERQGGGGGELPARAHAAHTAAPKRASAAAVAPAVPRCDPRWVAAAEKENKSWTMVDPGGLHGTWGCRQLVQRPSAPPSERARGSASAIEGLLVLWASVPVALHARSCV